MKLRWLIAALVIVAILAVLRIGVYRREQQPAKSAAAIQPAPAQPTEISLPSTVKAAVTVPVPVPIEGKIESFHVEVGDDVYEGQPLAQVRSQSLEAFRERAEADYAK